MVHVYLMYTGNLPDPAEKPELLSGLSEDRIQKILRCKMIQDRKLSLAAGLLMNWVLTRYGCDMNAVSYGENGKPEIEGICFNLSHSQEYAVCAVSSRPVGCDIEKIKELKTDIAKRFFSKREQEYLNTFGETERPGEFFRLWTMKESYVKMTGEGMHLAFNRFEFKIDNGTIQVFRDGKRCTCYIKEYSLPDYRLTVCAEETEFAEMVFLDENEGKENVSGF